MTSGCAFSIKSERPPCSGVRGHFPFLFPSIWRLRHPSALQDWCFLLNIQATTYPLYLKLFLYMFFFTGGSLLKFWADFLKCTLAVLMSLDLQFGHCGIMAVISGGSSDIDLKHCVVPLSAEGQISSHPLSQASLEVPLTLNLSLSPLLCSRSSSHLGGHVFGRQHFLYCSNTAVANSFSSGWTKKEITKQSLSQNKPWQVYFVIITG